MTFNSIEKLETVIEKIKDVKVALYGDFCLDAYWVLDPRGSEVSVETGLQAQAIKKQNYSLGGASNIAANLAALKPKEIKIFGVAGNDIFGREMISQLNEIGVDTSGLVIQEENFETYTFSKLILEGKEQPRIDFGTFNERTKETDSKILENLKKATQESDIVIINQQVPGSITNKEFIDALNKLIEELEGKLFIVDSRHFASNFISVSLKINELEAAQLSGVDASLNDVLMRKMLNNLQPSYMKNMINLFLLVEARMVFLPVIKMEFIKFQVSNLIRNLIQLEQAILHLVLFHVRWVPTLVF